MTDSKYFLGKISRPADSLVKRAVRQPRRAAIPAFVNTNGKTSQFGRYLTFRFCQRSAEKNLFATLAEGEVSKSINQLNLAYHGTIDGASTSSASFLQAKQVNSMLEDF